MLLEMFFIFFKIGAFTFGGGFAMLPIIQDELVRKKAWIEEDKFMDAIVVAQGSPGPIAVNISIYAGYQVAGYPGALVATLGAILPSFLIILVVAGYLYQYRSNPILDRIFKGVTPAIVGLILAAVYNLIKNSKLPIGKLVFSLLTFIIIAFLGVSPIYMIIIGALIAVILHKFEKNRE